MTTEITTARIVEIYNEFADKPVKKFRDRTTAEERLTSLLKESGFTLAMVDGEWTAEPLPEVKPRGEFADTDIISLNIEGNPKRKGTKAHARFALYSASSSVEDYIDSVKKLEKLDASKARRVALADLRWDREHQFVLVSTLSEFSEEV